MLKVRAKGPAQREAMYFADLLLCYRESEAHQDWERQALVDLRSGKVAQAVAAYEAEIEPEPEPLENVIPIGQRCSILELSEDKCHWPIGDPGHADFFFCGGKSIIGLPYCAYHARIAYQPANVRRRDRERRQMRA